MIREIHRAVSIIHARCAAKIKQLWNIFIYQSMGSVITQTINAKIYHNITEASPEEVKDRTLCSKCRDRKKED